MTRSAPCRRVSPSNSQVLASPRNVLGTMLLLMPRDCGQVPAHPRKSSCDCVAAAFQGLWKITTHIWHQASPPMTLCQHQRMLFSQAHWDLSCLGPHRLYWMSSQQGNSLFPCGPKNPRLHVLLGICPSQQSTTRYLAAELQTLHSPCLQS